MPLTIDQKRQALKEGLILQLTGARRSKVEDIVEFLTQGLNDGQVNAGFNKIVPSLRNELEARKSRLDSTLQKVPNDDR